MAAFLSRKEVAATDVGDPESECNLWGPVAEKLTPGPWRWRNPLENLSHISWFQLLMLHNMALSASGDGGCRSARQVRLFDLFEYKKFGRGIAIITHA